MATQAEARAAGFATPAGTDLVTNGDDAITKNAIAALDNINAARGEAANGKWVRAALASTDHVDNIGTQGLYLISSSARAAEVGAPINAISVVEHRTGNSYYAHQVIYSLGSPGERLERWKGNYSGTYTWGPWRRASDVPARSLASRLLMEDFTRRRSTVDTANTGAVALRFDHGLAAFKSKILPLLRARGLKVSLALNSRSWNLAENSGVTQSEVNSWVAAGDVEIWNHGAHHTNATTDAELRDAIVTGLAELRAQLPAAVVDGFAVPGVGTPGYGGFNGGASVDSFYNTSAGRMILEHHAVSSGYMPGTAHRTLDGMVRQGQGHYTLDNASLSAVQSQIDQAINNRAGLQLMMHPTALDTSGSMTTATLTAVLDYIVSKRTLGHLVTLTPYELITADARPPRRPLDTGWRKLPTPAGVTGNVFMRRLGNDVHMMLHAVVVATAGHANVADLPTGFTPQSIGGANWRNGSVQDDAGTSVRQTSYYVGKMRILNAETAKQYGGYLTYICNDSWPTTLPGTPA